MKKDYEEYRDTGVLGGYHPEMAVLREQRSGEVMTTFRDTNYQQREDHLESQREMLIRGKVFHVTSVFPNQAIATPTDKMLSLIDAGFSEKGTAPDVSVDLGEPAGYTVAAPYRLAPGKGGYKIWQAKNIISSMAGSVRRTSGRGSPTPSTTMM